MIGVDGQYVLTFNLNGNSEFIQPEDLDELTIYEYAGNILPTFDLSFRSNDPRIFQYLNEGNFISVQVGRSLNESVDVALYPSTLKTAKDGPDVRYYEISGFAASIAYITNHNQQITDKISGIEAALDVAANNFPIVEGNITSSLDSQRWIQPRITDKQFLNNVILHSDLGDSFPVFAITADGRFILKDLLATLDGEPSWRFTKDPTEANDIPYDADVTIDSKAGFINNWIGYGKELKIVNNVSGEVNTVFEDPAVIMSLARQLDKSSEISRRYGGTKAINDNVHANYWNSFNHNLQSLANLSKIDNTLSSTGQYFAIKPLDIIIFREEALDSLIQTEEESSGLYIVSGVVRTFQVKQMSTVVIMNREAFNNVRVS